MKHLCPTCDIKPALERLGIKEMNHGASTGSVWLETNGELLKSTSSCDGRLIAEVRQGTWDDYQSIMEQAQEAIK